MMNKKLAICTPTRDGMFPINYVSASHSILKNPPKGWDVEYTMMRGCSDITNARNSIINQWYFETDVDAMMFMDSDIAMFVKDLEKMLNWLDNPEVDFIGANYCKKVFHFGNFLQTASNWNKKEINPQDILSASSEYVSSGEHKLFDGTKLEGLCEIDGIGMGAFIITRQSADVLFSWAKKNLVKTKFYTLGKCVEGYGVYNHISNEVGNFGEDFSMCMRIKKAGLRIFNDPDMVISHSGTYDWDANFKHFLDYMQSRTDDKGVNNVDDNNKEELKK
tara:strand:- start:1443 stop:2273 length:831 start_codon:yes stop_codon:yes gene_type:complete